MVQAHDELGWVCQVCGGARLVSPQWEQAESVKSALANATRSHRTARMVRIASRVGIVLGIALVLLVLVVRLSFAPGAGAMIALSIVPLLSFLLSVIGLSKVRTLRSKTQRSIEGAVTNAVLQLISRSTDGISAAQLANQLEISPNRAQQILTRLNVRDDVQSIVTDDGQLLYRSPNAGLPGASAESLETRVVAEPEPMAADASASSSSMSTVNGRHTR